MKMSQPAAERGRHHRKAQRSASCQNHEMDAGSADDLRTNALLIGSIQIIYAGNRIPGSVPDPAEEKSVSNEFVDFN